MVELAENAVSVRFAFTPEAPERDEAFADLGDGSVT